MDKLKTQLDLWKLEKYTKRRQVATPEFEQKGLKQKKRAHSQKQNYLWLWLYAY